MEPDGDWERSVLPTIKDVQQGLDGKCIGWEYPGRCPGSCPGRQVLQGGSGESVPQSWRRADASVATSPIRGTLSGCFQQFTESVGGQTDGDTHPEVALRIQLVGRVVA